MNQYEIKENLLVLSDEELFSYEEHIHVNDTWRLFWRSFELFWWLFCLSLKVFMNEFGSIV